MTTTHTAPFTLEQIGTGTARFPSGVPIPTHSDQMVDPYFKTRMPKEHQIDSILFWPQEKGIYPGVVLLHDWWGLTGQMKDLGARLACEGYVVIIPNLYGRLGGMVTAGIVSARERNLVIMHRPELDVGEQRGRRGGGQRRGEGARPNTSKILLPTVTVASMLASGTDRAYCAVARQLNWTFVAGALPELAASTSSVLSGGIARFWAPLLHVVLEPEMSHLRLVPAPAERK